MIIGIDHLAFGSRSVQDDLQVFRTLGYEPEFVETDLDDLDNKRSLMERFSGRLDMALLKKSGSLRVELLDHGHVVEECSYVHPVFEALPPGAERGDDALVAFGEAFIEMRSTTLGTTVFVPAEPSSSQFDCRRAIVDTSDVDRSTAFWQSVGFRLLGTDERVARLEFRSPLGGSTCELYVREERTRATRGLLDARGFNCIAFFSTDAQRDRSRFERSGILATESNRFRVGGKDLAIFWLRGPSGEVVEIIGLA